MSRFPAIKLRLGRIKARPCSIPAASLEMDRQVKQSIDLVNHWLASPRRNEAVDALRQTLRERASQR